MAGRKRSKRTTVKDIRTILRLTQAGLSVTQIKPLNARYFTPPELSEVRFDYTSKHYVGIPVV